MQLASSSFCVLALGGCPEMDKGHSSFDNTTIMLVKPGDWGGRRLKEKLALFFISFSRARSFRDITTVISSSCALFSPGVGEAL